MSSQSCVYFYPDNISPEPLHVKSELVRRKTYRERVKSARRGFIAILQHFFLSFFISPLTVSNNFYSFNKILMASHSISLSLSGLVRLLRFSERTRSAFSLDYLIIIYESSLRAWKFLSDKGILGPFLR